MSQPVKLSDNLVLDARLAGEVVERSIAGQVEFWARLGRSVDRLLEGQQVMALCRNAGTRPLSELLATVDAPEGRKRLAAYLETLPFPHFRAHPGRPGLLEKIDENGTRIVGRFINRKFVAVRPSAKRTKKPNKSAASARSPRTLATAGD
ncbi:MAG: TA system antitoxin ParD family protein [Steroidobacteraceae bacterium]